MKGFESIASGSVVSYPYLWAHQNDKGETEGRKDRPTAVGIRMQQKGGGDILVLFPITSKEPASDRLAAEIPTMEKQRGCLDADKRLWIILEEYNTDIIGKSFYLKPGSEIGRLRLKFLKPVLVVFLNNREKLRRIPRT